MKKVLVLCTGNSCRSQMAEAYLRYYGGPQILVYSAGIEAHGLNPHAVASMQRDQMDITHHTSNLVEEYSAIKFDLILTVCDNASENCPFFPGNAARIHQNFPDPAKAKGDEQTLATEFDRVRDQIKTYCKELIKQILLT